MHQEQAAIPLSRLKILLLSLGSWAFVTIGGWMLDTATREASLEAIFLGGVGVAGILFFGLCGAYALFKLFDPRPGLIIDANGITDNSSAVAAGRIPWADVTDVRAWGTSGQWFLVIDVIDPQKYIKRAGLLLRWLVAANSKFTGSPIAISSVGLSVDFEELQSLVYNAFETSRLPVEPSPKPPRRGTKRCARPRPPPGFSWQGGQSSR
jgi:hypothetical protein